MASKTSKILDAVVSALTVLKTVEVPAEGSAEEVRDWKVNFVESAPSGGMLMLKRLDIVNAPGIFVVSMEDESENIAGNGVCLRDTFKVQAHIYVTEVCLGSRKDLADEIREETKIILAGCSPIGMTAGKKIASKTTETEPGYTICTVLAEFGE